MTKVYLGLGSDLGDREANLRRALELLGPAGVTVLAASSLYETEPVDALGPGPFLNAVCRCETRLEPHALLRALKRVETVLGREPAPRNAPRPIDLDILLYGDRILDTPELTVPHPRMVERAFVLVPLAELAPDVVHPKLGRPVCELLASIPGDQGVRRWEGG